MQQIKRFSLILAVTLFCISCSKGFNGPTGGNDNGSLGEGSNGGSGGSDGNGTTPPPDETNFEFEPLLWENAKAGTKPWSTFVFGLIQSEAQDLLTAKDMTRFCRTYSSLSNLQKVNVAGQLIAAMTKYESSFNPLSRFHESTMGTDPITGQPVYSEGLLQLSYQDIQGYPFCQFDWNQDQFLAPTDPQKTILNPFKNLYCGVRILANQVKRKGLVVIGSGAYWAVIKENNSNNKIDEIENLVGSLKMCQ